MSEKIFIDKINIGKRHRKEVRNLDSLAKSIKKVGLLQPIVVRSAPNKMYKLVAGERRLKACRDVLGWSKIDATVVDLEEGVQSLHAEHDENEERDPFTTSERVAIGEAIEEVLGKRQGQRTDLTSGKKTEVTGIGSVEVASGNRTKEIAAEKAGFGSRSTYEKAKEAVANGTPELVQAMDEGIIKPAPAAEIAKQPPKEQRATVKRARAAGGRAKAKPKDPQDIVTRTIAKLRDHLDNWKGEHGENVEHTHAIDHLNMLNACWVRWQQETVGSVAKGPAVWVKPTVKEIADYMAERKNGLDAEEFFAYYERRAKPNGQWVDARGGKISNWKMCVITWEKNERKRKKEKDERASQGRVSSSAATRAAWERKTHRPTSPTSA